MKTNRSAFGFSQEIEAEGTIGTIPSFPGFANIADINVQGYAAATKGHLPYSNFNFVSLRCFYPDAQVSLLGDGVALILNEAGTNKPFLTVLNQKTTCPNFSSLCDFAKATNLDSCLRLIPECSLPTLSNDILVSERRDGRYKAVCVNGRV